MKQHGGSRPGAGAPPLYGEAMKRVNVTLDEDTLAKAQRIGGNVSAGLREAVRAYKLAARDRGIYKG